MMYKVKIPQEHSSNVNTMHHFFETSTQPTPLGAPAGLGLLGLTRILNSLLTRCYCAFVNPLALR